MEKTNNFSKIASPSLRGVLNSIGEPSTLTRGVNPLLFVMALMLMSVASFTAFAQSVTITPASFTTVQGRGVGYSVFAPGIANGTVLTLNWCTSSGGKAGVPPGVTTSSNLVIISNNIGVLGIATAATTPPRTYYFRLMNGSAVVSNIASLTVTAPVTVSGIQVKSNPRELTQMAGQYLDLNGLAVTLFYSNRTKEDVDWYWDFAAKDIVTTINGVPVHHGTGGGTVLSKREHNGRPITIACNGHRADTKRLTIVDSPKIKNPVNKSVVAGGAVSFTVGATANAGTLVYCWEVSPKGSSEWNIVNLLGGLASGSYSGQESNELTLTNVPVSLDGYRFRCRVTNWLGSAGYSFYSDPATLTVTSASATTSAVTVNGGDVL